MQRRILWLTVDVDDFSDSFIFPTITARGETKRNLFLGFLVFFRGEGDSQYWSIEGCMSRERHRVTWLHHHHAQSAERGALTNPPRPRGGGGGGGPLCSGREGVYRVERELDEASGLVAVELSSRVVSRILSGDPRAQKIKTGKGKTTPEYFFFGPFSNKQGKYQTGGFFIFFPPSQRKHVGLLVVAFLRLFCDWGVSRERVSCFDNVREVGLSEDGLVTENLHTHILFLSPLFAQLFGRVCCSLCVCVCVC